MAQTMLGLDLGARAVKAVLLESSYRGVHRARATPPSRWRRRPRASRRWRAPGGGAGPACWRRRAGSPTAAWPPSPGADAGVARHHPALHRPAPHRRRRSPSRWRRRSPSELAEAAWDWQSMGVPRRRHRPVGRRGAARPSWPSCWPRWPAPGIDPRVVAPPAAALSALLRPRRPGRRAGRGRCRRRPARPSSTWARAGPSLCVTVGGALEAARTLPFGAAAVARALARDLGDLRGRRRPAPARRSRTASRCRTRWPRSPSSRAPTRRCRGRWSRWSASCAPRCAPGGPGSGRRR